MQECSRPAEVAKDGSIIVTVYFMCSLVSRPTCAFHFSFNGLLFPLTLPANDSLSLLVPVSMDSLDTCVGCVCVGVGM